MVYNMTKFRQNNVRSIKKHQNKNNYLYRICTVIFNCTKIVALFIFNCALIYCASVYWVQLYRLSWSFNFKHLAPALNRARLACCSQKSRFAWGTTTNISYRWMKFVKQLLKLNLLSSVITENDKVLINYDHMIEIDYSSLMARIWNTN